MRPERRVVCNELEPEPEPAPELEELEPEAEPAPEVEGPEHLGHSADRSRAAS